jgi:hypothetical protein
MCTILSENNHHNKAFDILSCERVHGDLFCTSFRTGSHSSNNGGASGWASGAASGWASGATSGTIARGEVRLGAKNSNQYFKIYYIRGLSKKYPTLGREKKVLYLGGYNT